MHSCLASGLRSDLKMGMALALKYQRNGYRITELTGGIVQRLRMKGIGLLLLATLVGVIGVQSPSYASSTHDSRIVPVSVEHVGGDTILVAFIGSDWRLGDCTLFNQGTKVEINATRGSLILDGTSRTSKTTNGDIWHSTFRLLFNGTTVLTAGPLDSKKMTIREHDYSWSAAITGLGPASAGTQLIWDSAC